MSNARKIRIGWTQYNTDIPKDLFKRVKVDIAKLGTKKNIWTTAALEFFLTQGHRGELVDRVAKSIEIADAAVRASSQAARKSWHAKRAPKTD